jgi:hypothetical protein
LKKQSLSQWFGIYPIDIYGFTRVGSKPEKYKLFYTCVNRNDDVGVESSLNFQLNLMGFIEIIHSPVFKGFLMFLS